MNQTVDLYESPEYRRSRKSYLFECMFEYFVMLLVQDAFLAKLLSSIGMDDAAIGIVSSLISFAFLVQLFSLFVVQRIVNTKRFVILFHCTSQLLFMTMYFVPFMPFAAAYRQALVVVCILGAYFGNYFVSSLTYRWANSYVEPRRRATYSAAKEIVSLVSGMVMTLVIGGVMDAFEASDNLYGGFVFAAISILVFCICNFLCLVFIKNDIRPRLSKKDVVPLRQVMKSTMGNRDFVNVVILTVLWNMASYTTMGFLGTYRVNTLAFTVLEVQLINIVGNAGRVLLSRPIGRYSDGRTYAKGIELALGIAALAFLCNVFTTPETRYLMVVFVLLHSICLAGMTQNMFNIAYSYVDSRYFVQASAIKNSIGGVCGFLTSLAAARLLSFVQENGNMLFGIPMYGQQLLSLISFVLVVVAILFNHFVICRQHVMIQ